jgi:hypothetical protein
MDAKGLLMQLTVMKTTDDELGDLAVHGVLEEFVRTNVTLSLRKMRVDQGRFYPSRNNGFLTAFGYNTTSFANAAKCDLYAESKDQKDSAYINLQCLNLTVGTDLDQGFADSWLNFHFSIEEFFFFKFANNDLSLITLLMTKVAPSFLKKKAPKELTNISDYYVMLRSGKVEALKDLGGEDDDAQFLVVAYSPASSET